MPRPAREILVSPDSSRPSWAVFDAHWYLRRYQAARERCENRIEAALDDYLNIGASLAYSPNPYFDEAFYCAQNPDVLELVRAGHYQSGFDHFCQYGHRALSPHWLFDDQHYQRLYEDMSIENLDQNGFAGRYDHYLKFGQFEGRQAHFIFDGSYYRQQAIKAGIDAGDLDTFGPYSLFLNRLYSNTTELPPSIYFNPQWYIETGVGVQSDIKSGVFHSAIEHYLCNLNPEIRDPVPEFSEVYYCEANQDINSAIQNGTFRCGYQHFVQFGAFELRRPSPNIDLVYYRDMNPQVRDDLNSGAVRDAFAHLRLIGLPQHLVFIPAQLSQRLREDDAKQLFFDKARDQLISFSRQKIDFTSVDPAVSVVMVLFNKFELTMQALASLRNNMVGDIQLIVVDNASVDDTRWIDKYITGASIHHLSENIGYLRAANLALKEVKAGATLYLNNDIELGYEALKSALARLESSPDIGAVGGKIIRTHGLLQEAGSIIWSDGTTTGYMRDTAPSAPEVNFVRDVDYCSAVFLLCRSSILRTMHGFDEDYSPSYYEDVDLCVRIFQAGHRVIYDPAITIYHYEYGSAVHSDVSVALMRRGHKIFQKKHRDFLAKKCNKFENNILRARSVDTRGKNILFLEDTLPLRHLGSGFVRSNDIVNALAQFGYKVSVFPINGTAQDLIKIYADFPSTSELLYNSDINGLEKFLRDRENYYDLLWISRTHNLSRILPILSEVGIDPECLPIILDTEAVTSNRDFLRTQLNGESDQCAFQKMLATEFSEIGACRHVIAVNQIEYEQLRSEGVQNVSILGTMRKIDPTQRDFQSRTDILIVASIHQADSPNLDSLIWYMNEILPALSSEMDEVPVLNVVGYVDPSIDLSVFNHQLKIKFHGTVADLAPFYDSNRLFIAPTRFAAGTPYKVYEAASFGLPCVVTDILVKQLGWRDGVELFSASRRDPKRFAAQIAKLYGSAASWQMVRKNAIERIERENSKSGFDRALGDILEQVFASNLVLGTGSQRNAPRKPMAVG
ncbi:MAG: glycosyltransferase [Acidocella sp.]|nr:glycosyltransferase [Acidocella sp.]